MVDSKNNIVNLFNNADKDKSVNKNTVESYPSIGDQAYKIIKNKIIFHEIKPRERIIDKKLAEELCVSRSVVRQVLSVLTKEELLKLIPRNGFYVREITSKGIEEIYNVRKVLEAYATELAVPRINSGDIAALEEVFRMAKRDLEKEEVKSFIEADVILHKILVDNCGNECLIKIINKNNDKYAFYRIADLNRIERAKESYFEHYEIFKAVKEKKVKFSAELMAKHIENTKKIILNNFDSYTYK